MTVRDQTGRSIEIHSIPKRIISIVPSQTELIWDLGLRDELVGITKFCIHPKEMFRTKTRVGGTKQLNFDAIKKLNPDLIIANKEENEKEQIEALCKEFPVWISDIKTLDDAYQMMSELGKILDKEKEATSIIDKIKLEFSKLKSPARKIRTAYFIWKNPWMLAGRDTFINKMLQFCGFENIMQDENSRYPEIELEELKKLNPELILLSSEPYPFKEKHIKEFETWLPNCKTIIVDGELFSWYGSRLVHSPGYFNELNILIDE